MSELLTQGRSTSSPYTQPSTRARYITEHFIQINSSSSTFISHFLVNLASSTQSERQESLALARMARDDLPASSRAATMRGKVGSEFEA